MAGDPFGILQVRIWYSLLTASVSAGTLTDLLPSLTCAGVIFGFAGKSCLIGERSFGRSLISFRSFETHTRQRRYETNYQGSHPIRLCSFRDVMF